MKNVLTILFVCMFMMGCDIEDTPVYHEIEDNYLVYFSEPPIEIMSNRDEDAIAKGELLLNYYNIIQISDNLYYMYYEAFKDSIGEFTQGVYFAYSRDCLKWNKKFYNHTNDSNEIIKTNVSGVSVMKVPDKQYPFRMFTTRKDADGGGVYMWKSEDGMNFKHEQKILTGSYDTQNAGVLQGNIIKLYTRLWKDPGHIRKIGVAYLDLDGNLLSSPLPLQDNYVYNPAATSLNEMYDILFPTHFTDVGDDADKAYVESYIVSGYNSKRIDNNLSEWIHEPLMMVMPGILTIGGEQYISFNTRSWSHMSKMPKNGESKYKLIKINIE